MGGRFLERLFARFGYGLIPLTLQDEERRASARSIEALELKLLSISDDQLALKDEIRQLEQSHNDRLAQLWAKVAALRSSLDDSRAAAHRARKDAAEQARRVASERAAEAEVNAAALAQNWAKLEASRAAEQRLADQLALQAQMFAERSAAERDAGTAALAALWARLEGEQRREAHAKQARADSTRRMLSLRQASRAREKQTRDKLETERALSTKFSHKLFSEQKRSARLARALASAKADGRAHRLEAQRARGEEQRLLTEIALATPGGAIAAPFGDRADGQPEWLGEAHGAQAGGRRQAEDQFQRGRVFQSQGEIGLAAACYRKAGPYLKNLLVQEGPDGDRISGPDFLIVGAARAGTTWLKKCLAHHPQVFILSGEHHYFSTSSHLSPESYVGRFANAHTRFQRPGAKVKQFARPSERLYGEKSTTYLAMPQAQVDLCAALFPSAKLICMVRDPAERVWSHLKHLKSSESLRNLDELSDLPPWMEVDELIRQGRYEEHLIRWARRFDPAQILLVDFKRLASEPEAVHAEVLAHIGAEPAATPKELDGVIGTERLEMPTELAERLEAAFEQERYDIPYLREAMQRAAEAQRAGHADAAPPAARKRPVRMAG